MPSCAQNFQQKFSPDLPPLHLLCYSEPMRKRSRDEQDYWLRFCDKPDFEAVTEEEREEFYRFDSTGAPCSTDNPILWGKIRHGQTVAIMRQFDRLSKKEGWYYGNMMLDFQYDTDTRLMENAYGKEEVARRQDLATVLGYVL